MRGERVRLPRVRTKLELLRLRGLTDRSCGKNRASAYSWQTFPEEKAAQKSGGSRTDTGYGSYCIVPVVTIEVGAVPVVALPSEVNVPSALIVKMETVPALLLAV